MKEIEKKYHDVFQNGKWWGFGYWEDEKILSKIPFSKEDIKKALDLLKREFTPEWFLKNIKVEEFPRKIVELHPLINYLTAPGLIHKSLLIELSQDIERVGKIKGGKKLIQKLKKDRENFDSNWDEIKIASALSQYFGVQIPKDSPDIIVEINDSKVGIEIKSLLKTRLDKILNSYLRFHFVPKVRINGFKAKITFLPSFERVVDVCKRLDDEDCYSLMDERLTPLLSKFHKNIKKGNLIGETKYFKYTLNPAEDNNRSSCEAQSFFVSNPEIRIINKIEEIKKSEQIPKNLPGIIIFSRHSLFIDEDCMGTLNAYLKSQKQRGLLSNICAVFLFHYYYLFTIDRTCLGKISILFSDSPYWNKEVEMLIKTIKEKIK